MSKHLFTALSGLFAAILIPFISGAAEVEAWKLLTGATPISADVIAQYPDIDPDFRLSPVGETPQVGVWSADVKGTVALAREQGIPVIGIWSSGKCHWCEGLERIFLTKEFNAWARKSGVYLAIDISTTGSRIGYAYTWCGSDGKTSLDGFPFVRMNWLKPRGGGEANTLFMGRNNVHGVNLDSASLEKKFHSDAAYRAGAVAKAIAYFENVLKDYSDSVDVHFAEGVSCTNALSRYEAQIGLTTNVWVRLTRGIRASSRAVLVADYPGTSEPCSVTNVIAWESGELERLVPVATACAGYTPMVGDNIRLTVTGEDGSLVLDENAIVYVDRANAVDNPLWLGARDADTLDYGEWTMDLETAQEKTRRAGAGYTLLAVVGELWCGDCTVITENLFDQPEFAQWAKDNQITLVSVDTPYDANRDRTGDVACLLTDKPRNGKSGAGYLSRNGLRPDADEVAAVFERNVGLRYDAWLNSRPGSVRLPTPSLVLLRPDGTIGALERNDALGRLSTAAILARLDELVALAADPNEADDNEAPTTHRALNLGGAGEGTVAAIDGGDWFKLDGFSGPIQARFTVSLADAPAGAQVKAGVYTGDSSAAPIKVQEATGVNFTFDVDCARSLTGLFVEPVMGLGVEAPVFASYRVEATPFVHVEAGSIYRLRGCTVADADLLEVLEDGLYRAKATGDVTLSVAAGEEVEFREWITGTVAFTAAARRVAENAGVFRIAVERRDGSSGAVRARVALADGLSTLEAERYVWTDQEVVWDDGETGVKTVTGELNDNIFYDGDAALVFTLELVEGYDSLGDIQDHTVTVLENDKAVAGTLGFTKAQPAFVKSCTTVARVGETVALTVSRTDGGDGDVTAVVTRKGDASFRETLTWKNHGAAENTVRYTVREEDCGKTVYLLLSDPTGGAKLATGKTVAAIQVAAAEAPAFEGAELTLDAVQYTAARATVGVTTSGPATVARVSGSLPAGMTLKADPAGDSVTLAGTPTKAGTFVSFWQVAARVGGATVKGTTIQVVCTVKPVTEVVPLFRAKDGKQSGTSVLKLTDCPVLATVDGVKTVVGMLTLTVPPTGRVTAKYDSDVRTAALRMTAKGWTARDDDSVTTRLEAGSYAVGVRVDAQGVSVSVDDPEHGTDLEVLTEKTAWSKADSAAAFVGQYNVALLNDADIHDFPVQAGHGGLALTLTTAKAARGTVTYAGWLPDGTACSGSSVLVRDDDGTVWLPVFKRCGKQVLSGLLRIDLGAETAQKVTDRADSVCVWTTAPRVDTLMKALKLPLRASGGSFDASRSLAAYYQEEFRVSEAVVGVVAEESCSEKYGALRGLGADAIVTFGPRSIKGRGGVNVSYRANTGVFSGTVKLPFENGTVSAKFRGLVLFDFQSCGCEDGQVEEPLPFGLGTYWFTDQTRRANFSRGGVLRFGEAEN